MGALARGVVPLQNARAGWTFAVNQDVGAEINYGESSSSRGIERNRRHSQQRDT